MEQTKRKLKGIADLYRIEDARKQQAEEAVAAPLPVVESPRTPKAVLDHLRPPQTTLPENIAPSIAPKRDFNRRANSIERDAMPSGLFPGSTKKLYDAIYLRTRGAVKPIRTIKATRRELMKWTGIKNIKTIASHIQYLTAKGLLIHIWQHGSSEGSIYEVILPEEFQNGSGGLRPPQTTLDGLTTSDQNMVLPLDQNMVSGGLGETTENKGTYASLKTSFNTKEKEIDDEINAGFYAAFQIVAKELTGRELTTADKAKFNDLAELLVAELRIAAARTESVSNVPAFLTEHLRRRLWKREKEELQAEAAKPDTESTASQKLTKEQIKSCPDCGGSGFCYPNGYDGGVVRCQHAKLNMENK